MKVRDLLHLFKRRKKKPFVERNRRQRDRQDPPEDACDWVAELLAPGKTATNIQEATQKRSCAVTGL